jgi:hypothetical protein
LQQQLLAAMQHDVPIELQPFVLQLR